MAISTTQQVMFRDSANGVHQQAGAGSARRPAMDRSRKVLRKATRRINQHDGCKIDTVETRDESAENAQRRVGDGNDGAGNRVPEINTRDLEKEAKNDEAQEIGRAVPPRSYRERPGDKASAASESGRIVLSSEALLRGRPG